MKLKICLVNSFYYPTPGGGSEFVARTLAETFKELGLDVFVITTDREDSVDFINGVKIYRLNHRNVYWGRESKSVPSFLKPIWHTLSIRNPFLLKKISDIIKSESPDIVHTHNIPSISYALWPTVKSMHIPVVHTLHDHALLCIKANMFRNGKNCKEQCIDCRFFSNLKRPMHEYIDIVTAPSRYILERHRNFGFFTKTPARIIKNPVKLKNLTEKHRELNGKPVFGFIGTLYKAKGIEFLIDVFNELDGFKLLIAGEAESERYWKYLHSLAESPNIEFLGYVDSKTFFEKIDVLIVPSILNDVSPLVIPQAYSHGIPVVASNRGGLPELIDVGKTGEIFDKKENLIEILKKMEDPVYYETLSIWALRKSREFDAHRIAGEYIKIYEDFANL